jgi:hypothetical protein
MHARLKPSRYEQLNIPIAQSTWKEWFHAEPANQHSEA